MKKTVPKHAIEVCDFCERGGYLQTCPICGRQFCLACHGIIGRCWIDLEACGECAERGDVRRLSAKYAAEITPIIERGLRALKRLPAAAEAAEAARR